MRCARTVGAEPSRDVPRASGRLGAARAAVGLRYGDVEPNEVVPWLPERAPSRGRPGVGVFASSSHALRPDGRQSRRRQDRRRRRDARRRRHDSQLFLRDRSGEREPRASTIFPRPACSRKSRPRSSTARSSSPSSRAARSSTASRSRATASSRATSSRSKCSRRRARPSARRPPTATSNASRKPTRRSAATTIKVTYRLVNLPNGRVDLVFTIDEGDKTGIKSINFVGNNTSRPIGCRA